MKGGANGENGAKDLKITIDDWNKIIDNIKPKIDKLYLIKYYIDKLDKLNTEKIGGEEIPEFKNIEAIKIILIIILIRLLKIIKNLPLALLLIQQMVLLHLVLLHLVLLHLVLLRLILLIYLLEKMKMKKRKRWKRIKEYRKIINEAINKYKTDDYVVRKWKDPLGRINKEYFSDIIKNRFANNKVIDLYKENK
jgi:hypothetical protein